MYRYNDGSRSTPYGGVVINRKCPHCGGKTLPIMELLHYKVHAARSCSSCQGRWSAYTWFLPLVIFFVAFAPPYFDLGFLEAIGIGLFIMFVFSLIQPIKKL